MFCYITCLAFLCYLLIGCKNKQTISSKPDSHRNLSLTEAKNFLATYNLCLDASQASDSFNFRKQHLDSIIDHEHELVSDAAMKIVQEAYYNRAYDYDEASNYILAKNDFEKVLLLAQQIGYDRPSQQFNTLNRLASIYNRLGDINRTLIVRKQQLEFCERQNNPSNLVTTYINLGVLNAGIGQVREAVDLFKKGLALDLINDYDRGKLLASLAATYIDSKQTDSAYTCVKKSIKYLEEFDAKEDTLDWQADNFLTLSSIYNLQNDIENRNIFFQKATAARTEYIGNQRTREIGKLLLTFCRPGTIGQKDIRNIQHAIYSVTDIDTTNIFAVPQKQQLYAENTIMEALDAKAEWMTRYFTVPEKQKYLKCAVDCYDLSFEVERKLLLNFSYDESKIRMLKESRQRSEKAIALCYTLYTETKDEQWIEKAFRFAERNKAFVLLESIKRNLAASQIVKHDTLFQKVQQLQMEYSFAEKSLLEIKNSNDTSGLKQLEEAMNNTDEQLQLAKTSLYQNNNGYRQWMEKEDSISIGMMQKLIADNKTAVIEYFIGDSASYAIIATAPGRYRFISISNNNLPAIDSFQHFFQNKNTILNDPQGYQEKANTVYLAWVKPCLEGFEVNKLVIIPDDKLTTLPFDALVKDTAPDKNLRSWSWLIKDYETVFGYSVSTLMKQKNTMNDKKGIAAFAPGFLNGERNMQALPFTAEEVDNIGKENKTALYKEKTATLAQFRRSVNESGVIHIASHARADNAGEIPAIEFIDSTLLLNELYAMKVSADLLVLSACQTGIGKIEKSEGAMSLARGFYYAGAKNIITSLWSINDHSTAMLFKDFYKDIDRTNYSSALCRSKRDYLSSTLTNDKYSPYYWAGFICIGLGEQGNKHESNSLLWVWLIASVLAVLAAVIYFIKRNKKRTR